jgi:hypothetical protein
MFGYEPCEGCMTLERELGEWKRDANNLATQVKRLGDEALKLQPVLAAAIAWVDSRCDRLAGCDYGSHDEQCATHATEVALVNAVNAARGT